jgi:hypothetical protein
VVREKRRSMNVKKLRLYLYLAVSVLLCCIWLWLRAAIPHARAILHDPRGSERELVPEWSLVPMFMGVAIFHVSWVLEKYFNYRIRRAQERHGFSQGWMASIRRAPREFKPEERIAAIDTHQVTQLELRKAQAKAWFSDVYDLIAFTGSIVMTFPLWPLLYMMYGALIGIEK